MLTGTPPPYTVEVAAEPALDSDPSLAAEGYAEEYADGYDPAPLSVVEEGVTVTVMRLVSVTVTGTAQEGGVDTGAMESDATLG